MIIQLYEMTNADDARICLDLGVEHLGFVVTRDEAARKRRGWTTVETAQKIFAIITPPARRVVIIPSVDVDEIVSLAKIVRPDILHLSMHPENFSPAQVAEVRRRLPGQQIMQAIPVGGPETHDDALRYVRDYEATSDFFLIDTRNATGIGSTGITNDWATDREIVEMTHVPVILAGGLGPDNVADAIRAVRPYGVDSFTHTNTSASGPEYHKDRERSRRFVEAARQAAKELGL